MAVGATMMQERFENPREILGDRLREGSIYRLLADYGDRLFDERLLRRSLQAFGARSPDGAGPGIGHGDAAASVRRPLRS